VLVFDTLALERGRHETDDELARIYELALTNLAELAVDGRASRLASPSSSSRVATSDCRLILMDRARWVRIVMSGAGWPTDRRGRPRWRISAGKRWTQACFPSRTVSLPIAAGARRR